MLPLPAFKLVENKFEVFSIVNGKFKLSLIVFAVKLPVNVATS
jgi:hypothetical protein